MPLKSPDTFPEQRPVTRPTIALLTDFGLEDPYVGQMKGVLAGLAPEALLVDISHHIRPFDVLQGAFYLAASLPHFPQGTIFLAVVDPGVGTKRRLILIRREGRLFLAPDNGLLALLAESDKTVEVWDVCGQTPDHAAATFHGRDVLAPLAARLANGTIPSELGPVVDIASLTRPAWSRPEPGTHDTLPYSVRAHVLHVDRFGNCLLNLMLERWLVEAENGLELLAPLLQPLALARTYGDIPEGGVSMLTGSQGYWELAVNRGSAARILGLMPGQEIMVQGMAEKTARPSPKGFSGYKS